MDLHGEQLTGSGSLALQARGARVEQIGEVGPLDPAQVLRVLGQAGINEVLVEAGATLAGALVQQRCVDELLLYVAPLVLGDRARGLLQLPEPQSRWRRRGASRCLKPLMLGQDQRIRLRWRIA